MTCLHAHVKPSRAHRRGSGTSACKFCVSSARLITRPGITSLSLSAKRPQDQRSALSSAVAQPKRGLAASRRWDDELAEPGADWAGRGAQFDDRSDFPDITILSDQEQGAVLPWVATREQLQWINSKDTQGGSIAMWVAAALIFVVASSREPLIAVLGGFFPLYSKQLRAAPTPAAARNVKMRLSGSEHVGLWHTRLQEARVVQQPFTVEAAAQGVPPVPTLVLRVGDEGLDSFSTELEFPWVPGCEQVAVGDRVEVLVLSEATTFVEFKVLREIYLPRLDFFLADYPFLKRPEFLRIRSEIEAERYWRDEPSSW